MKKLWIWFWNEGGYNSCQAESKEEALRLGNKMAKSLSVNESSLHEGTWEELNKLDKQYGSLLT